MFDISFNGLSATYVVVRCARKTLGIVVSANGTVVVRAPYDASPARIAAFVERLKPWIFKHLAHYKRVYSPREFINGESLPYLGRKYKLKVVTDRAGGFPVLTDSCLQVHVAQDLNGEARRETVKQAIVEWYEVQARKILAARLDELALLLRVRPAAVKVKRQVRRWGSCTARGVINLNWQLVMTPPEVIDYVIVHELCHLRVHGHQREFWECVAQYLPDYKKYRKWLRLHGSALICLFS